MMKAIEAVLGGETFMPAASKKLNVPIKTLDNRIKRPVKQGSKHGVSTSLTEDQEGSLVHYLLYMAELGFPLTRSIVKAFAWAIVKHFCAECCFNGDYFPSNHW